MAEQNTVIFEEKQKKLFEKEALPYREAVYNAALRLIKDATEAQDLTQDTYLRAYKFFGSFREGTNIKGWLLKILQNIYINQYRGRTKQPVRLYLDELGADDLLASETPEAIFDNLFSDDIANALDQLDPERRLIFVLYELDGFSYKEIAEIADCPEGTVMSRLHRARKLLEESLWAYARSRGYIKKEKRKYKKRA